jgi:toxin ParE1/3/4
MAKWTPDAIADAADIWDYIASDNEPAADRTIDKIESAAARLDAFPRMGRALRKPKARQLVVAGTPYKLIYRVLLGGVEVLRVLHGARKWPPKG